MNINDITAAADMIIRAYDLTAASTPARRIRAIDAYCDDPNMTAIDLRRIRAAIDTRLA